MSQLTGEQLLSQTSRPDCLNPTASNLAADFDSDDFSAPLKSLAKNSSSPRWNVTNGQLSLLEAAYVLERFPSTFARAQLAQELGVSSRQIQIWFQNRRQRGRDDNRDETSSQATEELSMDPGDNAHSNDGESKSDEDKSDEDKSADATSSESGGLSSATKSTSADEEKKSNSKAKPGEDPNTDEQPKKRKRKGANSARETGPLDLFMAKRQHAMLVQEKLFTPAVVSAVEDTSLAQLAMLRMNSLKADMAAQAIDNKLKEQQMAAALLSQQTLIDQAANGSSLDLFRKASQLADTPLLPQAASVSPGPQVLQALMANMLTKDESGGLAVASVFQHLASIALKMATAPSAAASYQNVESEQEQQQPQQQPQQPQQQFHQQQQQQQHHYRQPQQQVGANISGGNDGQFFQQYQPQHQQQPPQPLQQQHQPPSYQPGSMSQLQQMKMRACPPTTSCPALRDVHNRDLPLQQSMFNAPPGQGDVFAPPQQLTASPAQYNQHQHGINSNSMHPSQQEMRLLAQLQQQQLQPRQQQDSQSNVAAADNCNNLSKQQYQQYPQHSQYQQYQQQRHQQQDEQGQLVVGVCVASDAPNFEPPNNNDASAEYNHSSTNEYSYGSIQGQTLEGLIKEAEQQDHLLSQLLNEGTLQ